MEEEEEEEVGEEEEGARGWRLRLSPVAAEGLPAQGARSEGEGEGKGRGQARGGLQREKGGRWEGAPNFFFGGGSKFGLRSPVPLEAGGNCRRRAWALYFAAGASDRAACAMALRGGACIMSRGLFHFISSYFFIIVFSSPRGAGH